MTEIIIRLVKCLILPFKWEEPVRVNPIWSTVSDTRLFFLFITHITVTMDKWSMKLLKGSINSVGIGMNPTSADIFVSF